MVEPLIRWEPSRLRLIGFVLAIVGASVLATSQLDSIGMTERQRLAMAGLMAIMGYYGLNRFPQLTALVTVITVAAAILIPVALSARVVRDIVSS